MFSELQPEKIVIQNRWGEKAGFYPNIYFPFPLSGDGSEEDATAEKLLVGPCPGEGLYKSD